MKKLSKVILILICTFLMSNQSFTSVFAEDKTSENVVENTETTSNSQDENAQENAESTTENTNEVKPTENQGEAVNTDEKEATESVDTINKDEANTESTAPVESVTPTENTTTDQNSKEAESETAPSNISFRAAPVAGQVTLTVENLDGVAEQKTYNSEDEVIGMPTGWGNSSWHIRTYRKLFLGWTPLDNFTGAKGETIYSYGEKVGTIIANGDGDKPLHAVYASQSEFLSLRNKLGGEIEINKDMLNSARETLPEADVNLKQDNFEVVDKVVDANGAVVEKKKKVATVYYDATKDRYDVKLDTSFNFSNSKVAGIVANNPLGVLDTAKNITDFSGANPQNYTYVDLHVKLDDRFDVATQMKDLQFTSGLFMARAVLDEQYQVLKVIDSLPQNGEKTTTFSFDNPNKLKSFIIRTTLRNSGQDQGLAQNPYSTNELSSDYIYGDMILTSGANGNVTISREVAERMKDTNDNLKADGHIQGSIKTDKSQLGWAGLLVPNNMPIPKVESENTVDIKFETAPTPKPTPEVKPQPEVKPEPKQPEVKKTCADEGKIWSEEKQSCVVINPASYKVPNTATSVSTITYYLLSLTSLAGIVALKLRRK